MISILTGLSLEIWRTIEQAAPYILFGIFVSGLIQTLIKPEQIVKYLGQRNFKSVFLAAVFGIPLPLCSCGAIPAAVSLRKNGASKGSVLSFLISTPETGMDSIALSYALLDQIMTVYRPAAAFVTAIFAGVVENIVGEKNGNSAVSSNACCSSCNDNENKEHNHSLISKFKHGMQYAFVDLLGDIAKWLMLGIIIAGIIAYFVPPGIVEKYLGYDWLAMLIMLVIGIPLYICASCSTPIAAALIAKGMSPGVALVFLLAGPATNMAGIIAVAKFLGKRTALIYLTSISICTIALGLLLNQIYLLSGINIKSTLGQEKGILPDYISITCVIILIILMVNATIKIRRNSHCR